MSAWDWAQTKAHLERTGVMDARGNTRAVRPRTCPGCGALALEALDAPICAVSVRIDPTPLGPVGEALARLTGRRTYHLHHAGGRHELDRRSAGHIAHAPAGTTRGDVVAEHACGATPLPAIATHLRRNAPEELPDEPPF